MCGAEHARVQTSHVTEGICSLTLTLAKAWRKPLHHPIVHVKAE